MKRFILPIACAIVAVSMLAPAAPAKNVDLSTVPNRATVQLTIYNSEDITLVRETRKVTFKKGANPLQFSWANTLIDPSSVELRFKTNADKLSVVDTTFPHDKPQMLYWNVASEIDGEAIIEITYFTSGISWAADYVAVANADETAMGFEGFVRVTNRSGEDYEDAQVRLVVGKINLVEKIAQLARMPMGQVAQLRARDRGRYDDLRRQAANKALGAPDPAAAKPGQDAKQIIKEGLSEYFIYTIEGTETVRNTWSKRMRSFEGKTVPFKIQYRYRPAEYGDRLMRLYLLTNNEDSELGESPLPDGIVRVFRDNGRDGLSFLTAHSIKYVPIGDKIELPLGVDPDVIFELVKLRAWRDNIWMQWNGGRVVRRVDDGRIEVDINASVVGWDDHAVYTQRIRNYTKKAIEIEVRRPWNGHVEFRSNLDPTLYDFRTPQFTTTVGAGQEKDHLFEILTHQGRNAKQNRVTLEKAEIKP